MTTTRTTWGTTAVPPEREMQMSNSSVVLITGGSGNVGRHVAAGLLRAGQRVRVPLGSAQSESANADAVAFDFHDPKTWLAVLENVNRVFLMRPFVISNVTSVIAPFVAMMAQHRVDQVAVLSGM